MDEKELIKFLKENLKVNISCDYDNFYFPRVNVDVILCNEKIHSSRDLLKF